MNYFSNENQVLLIGATSLVGYSLARNYSESIIPCYASKTKTVPYFSWQSLALEDLNTVSKFLAARQPKILIYAHAVCDVLRCEQSADWCYEVNVKNLENVVSSLASETRLIYISSDHVFGEDGTYFENSVPQPISAYGRSRVLAEKLVLARSNSLIVRAALAIGASVDGKTGHLDWLRYRTEKKLPISIIEDESRSVYWADDLAERIYELALSETVGLRHITAEQMMSRPELARLLMEHQNIAPVFKLAKRKDQEAPHLGRVELGTVYDDSFSLALPALRRDSPNGHPTKKGAA